MHVLVADDNRSAADALARVLERRGYGAEAVYGGAEACERLDRGGVDVVVTDLRMVPVDGMAVLRHARGLPAPPEVLVITGYGTVEGAVQAMRIGALDFLTKPVSPEQLLSRLEALRRGEDDVSVATGSSPAAATLRAQLAAAAAVRSTVLLSGEPGSGRRRLATELHRRGGGGELAILSHPGRADPGALSGAASIYLPGVDHLDTPAQRALLRLLDALDGPRIIAAAEPGWGGDSALYYRLCVLEIPVPALRDRAGDIPALTDALLAQRAAALGRSPSPPSPEQRARLARYRWPGNLRELAAVVERALVFGPGAWERPAAAPSPDTAPILERGFSLARHLEAIERAILIRAADQAGGDRSEMARLLGLERNTLRYKLNKYGLLDRG